ECCRLLIPCKSDKTKGNCGTCHAWLLRFTGASILRLNRPGSLSPLIFRESCREKLMPRRRTHSLVVLDRDRCSRRALAAMARPRQRRHRQGDGSAEHLEREGEHCLETAAARQSRFHARDLGRSHFPHERQE